MASPRGLQGLDLPEGPEQWRQNAILLMAGLALLAYGAFEAFKPSLRSLGPAFGAGIACAGAVVLLIAWRRIKGGTARPIVREKEPAGPAKETPRAETPKESTYRWERRVEVIPRALIARGRSPREYAVVLTDLRTVFVERAGGGALGRLGGGKSADPWKDDVSALAAQKGSIVVPHSSLRRLGIRKGDKGAFRIEMMHEPEGAISETIEAVLLPPDQLFDDGKKQGKSRDEVVQAYVEAARVALEKSIPRGK
jgi:hypothetical protein